MPHLSFFSPLALEGFVRNAEFNVHFVDTCGDSQLEKDENRRIQELEKLGAFVFDIDEDNSILRNRFYHDYLVREKKLQKKKQRRLSFLSAIFGESIL